MNSSVWLKLSTIILALMMISCTGSSVKPTMQRNGVHTPTPVNPENREGLQGGVMDSSGNVIVSPLDNRRNAPEYDEEGRLKPMIRKGTGQTINENVARSAPPNIGGTNGSASFNFEGESVQAVAKAILGDMLQQNYAIDPRVQGTVTMATPKPVSPAEALSLLEMVLGWNNARMIYSDGRYNIVPADQAMATGTVPARVGSARTARGFETRMVPLKYISAAEMEKILKPSVRPGGIVSINSGRNIITLSGTGAELENYLRTIQIFDVDWMSTMSVGVFPIQYGKAARVVADLEKVFGEQGKSPVAGMFRFMPLEGANAVLVISTQPEYLDDIEIWLERIDGAGNSGSQLFSYDLKHVNAKQLAQQLAQVYGASGAGAQSGASIMPGLEAGTLDESGLMGQLGANNDIGKDGAMEAISGMAGGLSGAGTSGGQSNGSLNLGGGNESNGGSGSVVLEVDGSKVGVSAVEETNSILVRASPAAWKSIREVIQRLDVLPMQVHIEAQIVEVTLGGALEYGVNWFFGTYLQQYLAGLGQGVVDQFQQLNTNTWHSIGASVRPNAGNFLFARQNAGAIINALDTITDTQILQSPSVMVRNNAEANFNVGQRIPINSTSINPGTGSDTIYNQVQYIDTGTILKVKPRVTKDGLVFLEIVTEVSSADRNVNLVNGNPTINSSKLKTTAMAQSGDTLMLAGLIGDTHEKTANGLPGLARIPVIGGLFGQQSKSKRRREVIVLLTPTLIQSTEAARDFTNDYGRRFRGLQPLYPKQK